MIPIRVMYIYDISYTVSDIMMENVRKLILNCAANPNPIAIHVLSTVTQTIEQL